MERLFGILLLCAFSIAKGYGERVDSLLLWQERAVAVLTNACRMAPIEFRDRYIGNSAILLPENYPPVPPLYWNRDLNAAARFHAVEMGLECGMVHDCNGISFSQRIKNFYSKSSYIAENIASGYQTPQQVVSAWLIDGRSAAEAAADKSGNDGHRANIMSSRLREIGCGYFVAGTGRNAKTYWCQDFGGGKSDYTYHPVCDASHLFFSKGQITFLVNLYDTAGVVSEITLILDGSSHPLKLDMGKPGAGTYSLTLTSAAGCRNYAVEILLKDGRTMRYPEEGMLLTIGEGDCAETVSSQAEPGAVHLQRPTGEFIVRRFQDRLVLTVASNQQVPAYTEVIDGKGTLLARVHWNRNGTTALPFSLLPQGLYILHNFNKGATVESIKGINCRYSH